MAEVAELNQADLTRYPGYLLARTRFQAFRNFDRHIGQPFGLRPVEYSILVLLAANRDVSQNQLAHSLGVAAPNMTAVLHKLEGRGLVERQRSETDRRRQNIVLTSEGKRVLRRAVAASEDMDKAWLARLSAGEQALLMELLCKLAIAQQP